MGCVQFMCARIGMVTGRGLAGTKGRKKIADRRGATNQEIADRKLDVGSGTFAPNFVMYFIILTTALTLHKSGATEIETSRQAAEALRPLAGDFAAILFTAGIFGTGLLAIPTLAGSAAYAFAETFAWRQGFIGNGTEVNWKKLQVQGLTFFTAFHRQTLREPRPKTAADFPNPRVFSLVPT